MRFGTFKPSLAFGSPWSIDPLPALIIGSYGDLIGLKDHPYKDLI
jgi:hypothetical protein